jgi:ABC-type polysaccharide transport system permease subunit
MEYFIVENSVFARIGRVFMKSKMLAIVIGKSIHLSGVSKVDFLRDKKWLRHELIHIQQYKKYGTMKFLYLYIVESIKNGYYSNCFEKEAREGAENIL